MKFNHFLAWWTITLLLGIYLYAILLPEKFANSPIVTQFTTMAGSVIMLVLGYFFGGMAEKNRQKSPEGTTTADISATITTTEQSNEPN